jgi:hypothetical protein
MGTPEAHPMLVGIREKGQLKKPCRVKTNIDGDKRLISKDKPPPNKVKR